jgi:hypothetical protein
VATGLATSAGATAQAAFNYANTISGGSASDNVARLLAQAAFNQANNAYSLANTASSNTIIIQGVNTTQNTNITAVNGYASGAFLKANNALANTSGIFGGSLTINTSLGVGTSYSGTTGEIRATNEVTAYYASDETLKENIVVISDALGKLKQVRGVMYDWKDSVVQSRGGLDDYFVRKHDTGVIAQDVEKVLPEVVANRPDGTKAVRYEKLAGIIIQAINELAEQVEEIKKRIE